MIPVQVEEEMEELRLLFIYASAVSRFSAQSVLRDLDGKQGKKEKGGTFLRFLRDGRWEQVAHRLIDRCEVLSIQPIVFCDDAYPQKLRSAGSSPPVIFVKGDWTKLDRFSGAVVGSRKATLSGRRFARSISKEIAWNGISVISGNARGIDSCAHQGAIDGKGFTAAVMGSGTDVIYPPENEGLYEKMAVNGCVLSQFPPGTPPLRNNFPMRNRVMAALSDFVLVIEASGKSGSLITARFGLELGKEVFAVPGHPLVPQSKGTNILIKNGANPVTCIGDILENYGFNEKYRHKKEEKRSLETLDDRRKTILDVLWEEMSVEELALFLGKEMNDLLSVISELELEGLIERGQNGMLIRKS